MPLIKKPTNAAFKTNLMSELAAGKPKAQSIAIALDVKRKAGGKVPPPKKGK